MTTGAVTGASTGNLTSPTVRLNKTSTTLLWRNGPRWDGVMPTTTGHRIFTDLTDPTAGPVVDDRQDTRCDIAWNDGTLWVVRGHATTSRISRFSYDNGYTADEAVDDVTVTGITTSNNDNSPVSMYRTPNGHLWVSVMRANNLLLQRSTDGGATWLASAANLNETAVQGPVEMTHFAHNGTTYLLLFGAEDNENDYRTFHIDQDATDISAGEWTDETSALPGLLSGEAGSDDHLCVRSFGNIVYVATKVERTADNNEPIALFVRQPAGTWARHEVVPTGDAGNRPTRPSVVIDGDNGNIYVMWGQINAPHESQYKAVALDSLGDLEAQTATVLLDGPPTYNDGALAPRAPIGSESGLLVVANDFDSDDVWRAMLSIDPVPAGWHVVRDGLLVAAETSVVRDAALVLTA